MTGIRTFKSLKFFVALNGDSWLAQGENRINVPGIPTRRLIGGKWRPGPEEGAGYYQCPTFFIISPDGEMKQIQYELKIPNRTGQVVNWPTALRSKTGEWGIVCDGETIWAEKPGLKYNTGSHESPMPSPNRSGNMVAMIVDDLKNVYDCITQTERQNPFYYAYGFASPSDFMDVAVSEAVKSAYTTKGKKKNMLFLMNLRSPTDYKIFNIPFAAHSSFFNTDGTSVLIVGNSKYCVIDVD